MAGLARETAVDRLGVIADKLKSEVVLAEQELTSHLARMPATELETALPALEKSNPLVRNVFIWNTNGSLALPADGSAMTGEERAFVNRYRSLFDGSVAWERGIESSAARGQEEKVKIIRAAPGREGARGGWIPWFEEDQVYVLGWMRGEKGGRIHGAELEFMVLLSRLVGVFPQKAPAGCAYALVDGRGQVVHQAGGEPIPAGLEPEIAAPLSPALPHWQVAIYCPAGLPGGDTEKSFTIISMLLLGIFLVAIVMGGALLTWQAYRNMLDSHRKTSFVSNVSHELKTPLTSIRMYAELLAEDRARDEDRRKHYLRVIASESQRLTRLVNNVLDFGRLEQNRRKYNLQSLALGDFLEEFAGGQALRLRENGMALNLDIRQGETIACDRDALEQILLNLVDNAIKYASAGRTLDIATDIAGTACRIRVMDRGPGISPHHAGKIFKKFYRADDSLTTDKPGSGLGLSIARGLARGMDGNVAFEPREGGGSCFVVVFPASNGDRI
jgi:signal transduction histidine kinase